VTNVLAMLIHSWPKQALLATTKTQRYQEPLQAHHEGRRTVRV
jgi:hypothetical protein